MTGVHFAEPQWLHLLWGVLAFVVLLAFLERRAGTVLSRFMTLSLQARLVQRVSGMRRALRMLFLALAGVFLVLAMMRPQWGMQFIATPRVGAEIMVCLDVSKSMLAEDVSPNRLERAKAELRDLLAYLKGDQVGLIVFAGRSSVLSPLTPDFGFLRLALDQAGPTSVSRGGTRLEEPVRKAIAGFGRSGDLSRSILLITDGEDQDSFPLEAAKDAAQRGIHILAIGFGDEAGSEITLTDPKTGVRSVLRDQGGQIVKSRLDGTLLREMAMLTEGAYIPAGTGVLDLKSIYERHIAGLTRGKLDGRGRSVRNDAFQWAILLALLCLVAAVASTSQLSQGDRRLGTLLLVIGISFCIPVSVMAKETVPPPAVQHATSSPPSGAAGGAQVDDAPPIPQTSSQVPVDPRAAFNKGLEHLHQEALDDAKRFLEAARAGAGHDGEVRFRALYNLGWVEVKRADASLEQDPQKALQALQGAASWFREAIALRPGHEDARHNLEIVLNRALILADRLANSDKKDLLGQLNQTIDAQRAFLEELRASLKLAEVQKDAHVGSSLRQTFRGLSARQLEVLAEGEHLSEQAGQTLETIRKKEEKERTAEEVVKVSQLENLLHYLHRARERMGQARSRMRNLLAEQAFRRASTALTELKRAREQLLDPKTRLDTLLVDGMALAQFTGAKAAVDRGVSGEMEAPLWLTVEYLQETQQAVQERVRELHLGVQAGLARAEQEEQGQDGPEQDEQEENGQEKEPPSPEHVKLLQTLREAEPWMGQAVEAFSKAQTALQAKKVADAIEPQGEALTHLLAARERFLDLKGLIERAWQDQDRLVSLLRGEETTEPREEKAKESVLPGEKTDPLSPSGEVVDRTEYFPAALELQSRNLDRGQRIAEQIVARLAKAQKPGQEEEGVTGNASGQDGKGNPADDAKGDVGDQEEQAQQVLKRLERANDLQMRMMRQMKTARLDLEGLVKQTSSSESAQRDLVQVQGRVTDVRETLELLRQLFFSVIEHLKETIRRQTTLNDTTKEIATLAGTRSQEETAQEVGPLVPRQQGLAAITGSIREALSKQADLMNKDSEAVQKPAEGQAPQAESLRSAAEKLATAQEKMQEAETTLAQSPPEFPQTEEAQQHAVEALRQALALLSPPPQANPNGQEAPSKASEQKQGEGEPSPQQAKPHADPSQLLQGVRDREAQRREKQERSRHGAYEPVEKDW